MADLVIEDGTGLDNADGFVSASAFVDFARKRGVTMTEDQASIHLILGMDLLLVYSSEFTGTKTVENSALMYPRTGATILSRVIGPNEIPNELKFAQMFAALASFNGVDLQPIKQNGQQVIKKKTGPLEKTFAYDANASSIAEIPQVTAYLALMLQPDILDSLTNVRI